MPGDNREVGFWEFNKDNIFTNILQVEDHFRRIEDDDLEHSQCITKHLYFIRGELEEGISHATVVEPDKVYLLKEIYHDIQDLLQNMKNRSVNENLVNVREIRKKIELLDDRFNTAYCKACSLSHNTDLLARDMVVTSDNAGEMPRVREAKEPSVPSFLPHPPLPEPKQIAEDLTPQLVGPFVIPKFLVREEPN